MISTTDVLILNDGSIAELIAANFVQNECLLIKILEDQYGFTTQYRIIIRINAIREIIINEEK